MVIKKNKKPNIVLITIDSLRGDYVNYENMPHLMDLIEKQGTAVFNAYTAGVPTYYAFPSIMCGVYTFKYGVNLGLKFCKKTIAEIFKKSGYKTLGFNAANVYTSHFWGYERGFYYFEDYLKGKKYKVWKSLTRGENLFSRIIKFGLSSLAKIRRYICIIYGEYSPGVSAKSLLQNVLTEIKKDYNTPFFLWIHLMDVHMPYSAKMKDLGFYDRAKRIWIDNKVYDKLFKKVNRFLRSKPDRKPKEMLEKYINIMEEAKPYKEFLRFLYTKSIQVVDREVSTFIKQILYDFPNTYFLITSDHGEEFFDNVSYCHAPLFHNDAVVRVPLMLIGDQLKNFSLPSVPISTVDILPTLCELAGINSPSELDGISVFSEKIKERKFVFTESLFAYEPFSSIVTQLKNPRFLISVHSKNSSTTILETIVAPMGSYNSRDLYIQALQRLRRIKEVQKIREFSYKIKN